MRLVHSLVWLLAIFACAVQSKRYLLQQKYKSGEVASVDAQKYGALEASMKGTSGSCGISGLVWIVPNPTVGWQEIGFETFGKDTSKYQTQIIVPGPPDSDGQPRSQYPIEETDGTLTDFHTNRIEWTPSYISWLFDGKEVRRETDVSKFSQFFDESRVQPMEIRATLWCGHSDWSGYFNTLLTPTEFDYISYETYQDGTFTPSWRDDFNSLDTSRWQVQEHGDPFLSNTFAASNVKVQDGNLVLSFTS